MSFKKTIVTLLELCNLVWDFLILFSSHLEEEVSCELMLLISPRAVGLHYANLKQLF